MWKPIAPLTAQAPDRSLEIGHCLVQQAEMSGSDSQPELRRAEVGDGAGTAGKVKSPIGVEQIAQRGHVIGGIESHGHTDPEPVGGQCSVGMGAPGGNGTK